MKRHRFKAVISILLLTSILTACTAVPTGEGSSVAEEQDLIDYEFTGKEPANYNPDDYDVPPTIVTKEQTLSIGEKAVDFIPEYGTTEYTLQKATSYTNVFEVGLTKETLFEEDADLISADGMLQEGLALVVLELDVKNVDIPEKEKNVTTLGLCHSPGEGKEATVLGEPYPYFINGAYAIGESAYWHYEVPMGLTSHVVLGWIVDTSVYELSGLYMCVPVNFGVKEGQPDPRKYVSLGL